MRVITIAVEDIERAAHVLDSIANTISGLWKPFGEEFLKTSLFLSPPPPAFIFFVCSANKSGIANWTIAQARKVDTTSSVIMTRRNLNLPN